MKPSSHSKLSRSRSCDLELLSQQATYCVVFSSYFLVSFLVQWESEIILISPHYSKQPIVLYTLFPPFISNSLPWWLVESWPLNPCSNHVCQMPGCGSSQEGGGALQTRASAGGSKTLQVISQPILF